MQNIIPAATLRQQMQNRCLDIEKNPGVYRWWFHKEDAEMLLSHFRSSYQTEGRSLQIQEIDGTSYVALYFGISNNLRRRIRWHVRGPFKSSTLRRTLRAITAAGLEDEKAEQIVNQLIDNCYWEWDYTDTEEQAEELETAELAQKKYAYPLNISKNHTVPAIWVSELKLLRSNSKNLPKHQTYKEEAENL